MRRTSFCHLTSSYEHPYLAGSRVVERLRARHRRSRLLHGRTSRFGGSHVAPRRDFTASGVVFPSRCVRTGPLTPLSPPARSPWSSRSLRSRAGRRDRPQSARVNDANQKTIRGAFHRSRTFAPQRPLGRPAPDFTSLAALPPRCPLPTPLHPRESFRDLARAGPPSTSSRCQQGLRFSRPRSSLADFCNRYDVRAHPSSCRSSHASGAFAPLLAGTNRCRLRWPLRCVATPRACEPQPAHAGFHSDVLRLRGRDESRVEAFEQRRAARSCDDVARALLVTPRAPGSPARSPRGLENLEALRSGLGPPRVPPREGRHRRKNQGAFRRDGTLTRAGDCSLVRAWTAAPSRRLRGGIARGTRAPFSPLLRRPPSDEESIRSGSTG
jgi:hypothetical protein